MSFEFLETRQEGHILVVTMARPEVYNAIHPPMHHEMHQVWDAFSANPDLWVAVLTGAGDKAFSAGNDLKYTQSGGDSTMPPTGFAGLSRRFDLDKPIIAAVNGFAMGGGFETALSCDIIIASERAVFALPEVKVGFFAAAGGVQRLSRYIGRMAATEMILTGRKVDAEEAKALGFITQIVPHETLLATAMAKAEEIAQVSPSAIKASKRVLNALARTEGLDDSLGFSQEVLGDLRQTEDFAEGVNAFVEKRAPRWVNR